MALRRSALAVVVMVGLVVAAAARAQSITAPGWKAGIAPDERGAAAGLPDSAFGFSLMPPGWHIVTGPPTTFVDPTIRADGRFFAESELYVVPGSGGANALGLVIGGRMLESGTGSGVAFLIRRTGEVGIAKLEAGRPSMLMPWRPADAVAKQQGTEIVKNILRVDADPDSLRFRVNGVAVGAISRAGLDVGGEVGLHVGRGHSLHITTLDVGRRYAPPRRPGPTS